MDKQMSGNIALVTGGGRGIGRGICVSLAQAGYDIVVNYQGNIAAANQTVAECRSQGVRAVAVQADIADAGDRARLLEETQKQFGRLDLLVNNAGITVLERTDILDASEDSFDRLLDVNLKGTYFLTQKTANWMVRQVKEDPERRPNIVIISSAAAAMVLTTRGEYCVSKAGLSMTVQLYAARLAEYGIGVFEIRPGVIETEITAAYKGSWEKFINSGKVPQRRWGSAADIGKAVVAIGSGLLPYSTGEVLNVDGGLHIATF